jgi:hypothetical protein
MLRLAEDYERFATIAEERAALIGSASPPKSPAPAQSIKSAPGAIAWDIATGRRRYIP